MNDEVKTSDMGVEQKREYYRENTGKYRKDWGNMDIVQINLLVPSQFKGYFQALAKIVRAEETTRQIEEHDPDLIEALANRQIRTGIDREQLTDNVKKYQDHGDDRKKTNRYKEAVSILAVFEMIGAARVSRLEAKKDNRPDDMFYWMAREYAASMHVQGAFELFTMREGGLKLPENIEL